MRAVRFLIIAIVFVNASLVPATDDSLPTRWANTTRIVHSSGPVSLLPKGVDARKGELTLFADFGSLTNQRVPVYLINRTGKAITLDAEDGKIHVKLEYEAAPNIWKRAEGHMYSPCGNSYAKEQLQDESFLTQMGYFPQTGERATVRYRLYQRSVKVASNVSAGRIDKMDVRFAAEDLMNLMTGDFEYVVKVARGELLQGNDTDHRQRSMAIHRLAEFTDQRVLVEQVLKECQRSDDKRLVWSANEALECLAAAAKSDESKR